MPIQHAQQPLGLVDIAVARALVFIFLARKEMEEPDLAEHRPDAAHLEHQPLQGLVALGGVLAEQLAALLRQVLQDRPDSNSGSG